MKANRHIFVSDRRNGGTDMCLFFDSKNKKQKIEIKRGILKGMQNINNVGYSLYLI